MVSGSRKTHPMTFNQIVKHFGTAAEAARKLGISRAAVSFWKTHGIPHSKQLHIELVTDGKLKAANGK
jgi:DNA-binding transcriptional regulator YdaS (Cro superfamily)